MKKIKFRVGDKVYLTSCKKSSEGVIVHHQKGCVDGREWFVHWQSGPSDRGVYTSNQIKSFYNN